MNSRLIAQQQTGRQLGSELAALLKSGDYKKLIVVVAFVRSKGVVQLKDALDAFIAKGSTASFIVGVSNRITSYEALKLLLEIVGKSGKVILFHNANPAAGIFHPKLYFFAGDKKASLIVASNNLTEGGLFVNYELATLIELNPNVKEDLQVLNEVAEYISALQANGNLAKQLTPDFLERLREAGDLEIEVKETASEQEEEEQAAAKLERTARQQRMKSLFGSAPVTAAPATAQSRQGRAAMKAPQAARPAHPARPVGSTSKLTMRTYPARGTQIQVPIEERDRFFQGIQSVTSENDGSQRVISGAQSRNRLNTYKLEIPETRRMRVPIVVFTKTAQGITYRVLEGQQGEGARLLRGLEQDVQTGKARQTRQGSSIWRVD